jgi:hypothetical protein
MRQVALPLICILSSVISVGAYAFDKAYPIHDGHIHYDEDVWDALSPEDAVQLLLSENITRALVSATPTEGAEMLYRVNPDVVIPMLRPYKNWRHRYLWFKDPDLKAYMLEHLARVPYRGVGEFHVFGNDANTKPVEDMIELVRERGLSLHPHTDLSGMKILLSKASDINVIWAHGGFDVPVESLRELFEAYPKLYIELSLRDGMVGEDGKLTQTWKSFLEAYPKRFLIGMDTYKPSRWAELPEIAAAARLWLNQLPVDIAEKISRENLDRLFPEK